MRDLSRYDRQTIIPQFGREGQERLLQGRVVVAGMGALGSFSASLLARAGVGHLRLIDRDFVELNNLQRQVLYEEEDARQALPKAIAARDKLARINSDVQIEAAVSDLNPGTVLEHLGDADVIVDAVDNFEARFLINDAAIHLGIPWVYGAVISTYGLTMDIIPGRTACLQCLLQEMPPPGSVDTCATAGILAPIVATISALQVTECLKLLLGSEELQLGLRQVDVWEGEVELLPIDRAPDCPACVRRELDHLNAETESQTVSLCGRDAVQVSVNQGLSLDDLAEKLEPSAEVSLKPFLLQVRVEGYEMHIFPDGRAIIKGTTDPSTARALYSKYIGI